MTDVLRVLKVLAAGMLCGALIAHGTSQPSSGPKPDRILVIKSKRTLSLMHGEQTLKTYSVALGRQPVGAKDREGDHKTPEGVYFVDRKLPNSEFHLALHLSYPDPQDRKRAKKLGVSPGGDVEIHGLPKEFAWLGQQHRRMDWTDGCIALSNAEIEEIFPLVVVGTPVEIRP